MNSSAKNIAVKPAAEPNGNDSDVRELGAMEELSLEGAEDITEEVTGVRKKVTKMTTPPPLPPKAKTETQENMEELMRLESERVADEEFQKKVPQAYRINPDTGKKERVAPFKPTPRVKDELDIQGT